MLKNIKKKPLNINEYLSKVKNVVNRLALISYFITASGHVEVIFNGMLEEYGSFIIFVNSRHETYTVEEINPLLLAQEARIKRRTRRNSTQILHLLIWSHLEL